MSKDITIRENGTARNLNGVRKLNTAVTGGGAANWIPEDETEVGTLTVTKNGEYVASSESLYAYYVVTVLVPGGGDAKIDGRTVSVPPGGVGSSIVGNVDGVRCRISVDENGYLVTETL